MKYTYQLMSESFSFANPEPTDVHHARSLREVLNVFLGYWIKEHKNSGTSPEYAYAWLSKGTLDSIEYPDFILKLGPRGGVRKENA